jgi:DNA polymerase elongation subunit (family B)
MFWCIQSVNGGELQSGILVADEDFTQETFRRFADVEIVVEPDEQYMINSLVDIVRDLDPDILTGYEVHSESWGYVIERARVINGRLHPAFFSMGLLLTVLYFRVGFVQRTLAGQGTHVWPSRKGRIQVGL